RGREWKEGRGGTGGVGPGLSRWRDRRGVRHERAHVLDSEAIGQIITAPADDVERVCRVDAARIDVADLRDDLEAAGLVSRVERARKLVIAPAVRDELPGRRRFGLLGIAGEALVHPVVVLPRPELEAVH